MRQTPECRFSVRPERLPHLEDRGFGAPAKRDHRLRAGRVRPDGRSQTAESKECPMNIIVLLLILLLLFGGGGFYLGGPAVGGGLGGLILIVLVVMLVTGKG